MARKAMAAAWLMAAFLSSQTGCALEGKAARAISPAIPRAPTLAAMTAVQDKYLVGGKILEALEGGGYTYMYIDNGGKKLWAAAPAAAVEVGDVVEIPSGFAMSNFSSMSLNRTFQKIIFTDRVIVRRSGAEAKR